MPIHEALFSVNDFKEPKIIENAEAIATLLTRLLLLEPGTIQSHPEMGVGLISNYRYSTEDNASRLQSNFRSQITKYLPDFQSVRVSVRCKDKQFLITAELDGSLFGLSYNTETSSINSKFSLLSDL